MNDHISKPINPEILFETVGRYFKPAAAGNVAPTSKTDAPQVSKPAGEKKPAGTESIPATALETLAAIDGLDTNDGLSRVAGNQKLYAKLLRQFIEQQGPAIEKTNEALAAGDVALAERIAHTLKGVAGNIGAKSVQSTAAVLEKAIRSKAPVSELDSAKEQVAAALGPLVEKLTTALTSSNTTTTSAQTPPSPPVDPAQSREAAAHLVKLLAEFDPGATDFLESNQAALRPIFPDGTWSQFEKLIQSYSFADAQTQLEQALKLFAHT
jgi:two-component system sensor histidine kinase/response regulator